MIILLLALAVSQSPSPISRPPTAPANAIVEEDRKPGTLDWEITSPALAHEIEGFASKTSVNGGEPVDLFVHTASARYTIDVFRTGWYQGAGARRVRDPIERAGVAQTMPPGDSAAGLVECVWRDPYRLETRDADGPWPSGVYLARLTAMDGERKQAFVVFVVRDDDGASSIVFQSAVTTLAAYNNWGGRPRSRRPPRVPRRRRLLLADPVRAERARRGGSHDRRLQGSRRRSRPAGRRRPAAERSPRHRPLARPADVAAGGAARRRDVRRRSRRRGHHRLECEPLGVRRHGPEQR